MNSFLNTDFIREKIVQKDVWAEGHGYIEDSGYLGTSILYYAFAYMLPAKVAVVLGSGAGFVPRLIRQAQRDIPDPSFVQASRCILIDADLDVKGFGVSEYHTDPQHFFRASYPEVEIWKMTTDEAFLKLQADNIEIGFLHIDADHTFQQSLKDFDQYLSLMSEDFIISLHDTAVNHLESQVDGCVARTIAYLRKEMQSGEKYDHLEMVNFNNRFKNPRHLFQKRLRCRGTAFIAPKTRTLWDTELGGHLWESGDISPLSHFKSDS